MANSTDWLCFWTFPEGLVDQKKQVAPRYPQEETMKAAGVMMYPGNLSLPRAEHPAGTGCGWGVP